MTDSNKSISPLRQRMIDDMTLRKLSPKTQSGYIRAVKKLSCFLGRSPDTATAEDLRLFQLHLVEFGVSSITLNATITGLQLHDRAEVTRLGLWVELAQRHIVDHALAQRADGFVRINHGSISCVVCCLFGNYNLNTGRTQTSNLSTT